MHLNPLTEYEDLIDLENFCKEADIDEIADQIQAAEKVLNLLHINIRSRQIRLH